MLSYVFSVDGGSIMDAGGVVDEILMLAFCGRRKGLYFVG